MKGSMAQSFYGWTTIRGNAEQHARWTPNICAKEYVIRTVPSHVMKVVVQCDCPEHTCQILPDDDGAYQIVLSKGARIILPLRKNGCGGKHDVAICVDSKGKLCVERMPFN